MSCVGGKNHERTLQKKLLYFRLDSWNSHGSLNATQSWHHLFASGSLNAFARSRLRFFVVSAARQNCTSTGGGPFGDEPVMGSLGFT